MTRNRLLSLDLLRCLSILAVIILHSALYLLPSSDRAEYLPALIYCALCISCVPVLFMISGALMLTDARPVNIAAFYRKRLPKILIPLLAWSLIYYIIYCFQEHSVFDLITFSKRFFAGLWSGPLWFLYMMAGISLMLPFVRPVFGGETQKISLLFVAIIFGAQALQIITQLLFGQNLNTYFVGALFPFSMAYLVLGNALFRTNSALLKKRITAATLFFLCAALVTLGGLLAKTHASVPLTLFYNHPNPLVMLMGAGAFLFFKDWNPPATSKRARFVMWLSGLSYGVFLSHVLVWMLLARVLTGMSPLVEPLVGGIATFIGAALLTWAIKSVPGLRRIIP